MGQARIAWGVGGCDAVGVGGGCTVAHPRARACLGEEAKTNIQSERLGREIIEGKQGRHEASQFTPSGFNKV